MVVTDDPRPNPTLDAIDAALFEGWTEAARQALYDVYGMRRGEFAANYTDADLWAWFVDPERPYTDFVTVAAVMFRKTFTGTRAPFPESDETRRVRKWHAGVINGRADAAKPAGVFAATARLHHDDESAAVPEAGGFVPLVLPPLPESPPAPPATPAEFEL